MKISTSIKTTCLLFILVILFPGCASTTFFTTAPNGASVFIGGEEKGTTPYKYSDTKIALSSTPITFKKNGYKDLNIILRRSEKPAVGAIIGGVLFYVPLLWFAEYNKNHFYELEKNDTFIQDSTNISKLNKNTVTNPNSANINQNDLYLADTLYADKLSELPDDNSDISPGSPGKDFTKRSISQFGLGGGFCLKGGIMGLKYTYIGSESWGGSISYNANPFKTENVIADYDRPFTPMDYVNIISLNVLKAFPAPKGDSRFSIEIGPSWVNYSKVTIVDNPNYDPNHVDDEWFWSFSWLDCSWKYKYNKVRSAGSTIGVSIMAKLEFLLSPVADLEFALFTNINNLRSIAGLGIYFNFGDVKD